MIPLLGFSPDTDPTTPGVITDCTNFIPTEKGMAGGPTLTTAVAGLAALAAECRGAAVLTDTLGARRTFAGTQTKLYELVSAAWTDRSRAGNYTGSVDNRWMFTQFGNVAIATNDIEVMQSSASGAFADIATAPKARIVISAKDFVIALNTNDGTYGDQSDRWWCSGFQDYSTWTPALATQATTGRLVGVPGEIVAGAMLGAYAVAYKELGAYLGQYVGSPVVWQWDQVPGQFGCVGPEAVVDIGGAHFVVGPDNFWLFDGTRPVPGTGEIRQWFFNDLSVELRRRTIVQYDRQNARVWVFYPSTSSTGNPDRAVVYHVNSKRWGRANRTVEAVTQISTPGIIWSNATRLWSDANPRTWAALNLQSSLKVLSVFDTAHNLYTLSGPSDSSSFTTGDLGDDEGFSYSDHMRVRFLTDPTTASATGYTRVTAAAPLVTGSSTSAVADGKFNLRQSGRLHRYAVAMTGNNEVSGIVPQFAPAGAR